MRKLIVLGLLTAGMAVTAVACDESVEPIDGEMNDLVSSETKIDDDFRAPPPFEMMKPPQEAFDACESLSSGDACTVSRDEQDIDGKCLEGPGGKGPLACVSPPPVHRMHGPPPEAFESCNDSAQGDACTMSIRGGETLDGTCARGPAEDAPLACRPNDMPEQRHRMGPPPHEMRRPPQEAFDACADLAAEATCEVEIQERAITGRCVVDRHDEATKFCAPDHMPPMPRRELSR